VLDALVQEGGEASIRGLVHLSQTAHGWQEEVRARSATIRPSKIRRNMDDTARRLAKLTAAAIITMRQPAALVGTPHEKMAAALAPSPAWNSGAYEEREVWENEAATVNFLYDMNGHRPGNWPWPPALAAVAASDMVQEQKHFFLGQTCGQMIIEEGRYMSCTGAAKLGEILGLVPLVSTVDFTDMLNKVQEIQEDKDGEAASCRSDIAQETDSVRRERLITFHGADGYGAWATPDDRNSAPLALMASWMQTKAGQPSRWSTKSIARVLRAVTAVMPTEVERVLHDPDDDDDDGVLHVNVCAARGTPAQYLTILQLNDKVSKTLIRRVNRPGVFDGPDGAKEADAMQEVFGELQEFHRVFLAELRDPHVLAMLQDGPDALAMAESLRATRPWLSVGVSQE